MADSPLVPRATPSHRRVGALDEPVVMPPAWWVVSLALVNMAIMSGWFGPIQVLLAEQARAIDASNKEAILSLVLGVGAAVSTVSNPVWGAFSDRTRSRRGRRIPWLIGGLVGGAASLLVLSVATNVLLMVVAWAGVQACLNMMFAGLTASVPDQVPVNRRGMVGGVLNVAQTFGVVLGVAIAGATGSIAMGYAATAAVLVTLSLPFLLTAHDPALPADHPLPPLKWGEFARSFWISPREHPDFAWAWITRFAINLGNNIGTMYLLYYVTDGLGFSEEDGAGRVFILTGVYAACTLLTAVVFGVWSDRIGRRKIFVTLSGIVAGIASLILGLPQTWTGALTAAVVLGVAFGIFSAVDFALITQVLPSAAGRAKDLGVINIAAALPQVVAPMIAGLILVGVREMGGTVATHGETWSMGYGAVYLFGFTVSVLGALGVTRIKSVQ